MQTLTHCDAKITSTRTAVGQLKGQFKGAMDEMSEKVQMQALTCCDAKFMSTRTAAGQFKGRFNGAMEEMSGKVQNASTHPLRSYRHEHAHNSWSVQGPVQGGAG